MPTESDEEQREAVHVWFGGAVAGPGGERVWLTTLARELKPPCRASLTTHVPVCFWLVLPVCYAQWGESGTLRACPLAGTARIDGWMDVGYIPHVHDTCKVRAREGKRVDTCPIPPAALPVLQIVW